MDPEFPVCPFTAPAVNNRTKPKTKTAQILNLFNIIFLPPFRGLRVLLWIEATGKMAAALAFRKAGASKYTSSQDENLGGGRSAPSAKYSKAPQATSAKIRRAATAPQIVPCKCISDTLA